MSTELGRQIGARIAQRRKEQGLTQSALGSRMDPPADPQKVSRWERAENELSFATLEAVAAALSVSTDELLTGVAADPAPESSELRRVVQLLASRSERELRAVRRVVSATLAALEELGD